MLSIQPIASLPPTGTEIASQFALTCLTLKRCPRATVATVFAPSRIGAWAAMISMVAPTSIALAASSLGAMANVAMLQPTLSNHVQRRRIG